MDGGAWWAPVHEVTESNMTKGLTLSTLILAYFCYWSKRPPPIPPSVSFSPSKSPSSSSSSLPSVMMKVIHIMISLHNGPQLSSSSHCPCQVPAVCFNTTEPNHLLDTSDTSNAWPLVAVGPWTGWYYVRLLCFKRQGRETTLESVKSPGKVVPVEGPRGVQQAGSTLNPRASGNSSCSP